MFLSALLALLVALAVVWIVAFDRNMESFFCWGTRRRKQPNWKKIEGLLRESIHRYSFITADLLDALLADCA